MSTNPNYGAARGAARKLLTYYGVSNPSDIDLDAIAFGRGILIHKAPLDGAEAWLLRKEDKGIIRVSSNIKETGRERFAIAHELGHWEQHARLNQFLCTTGDIHAYRGSNAELEANAFAAELLMPSSLIKPFISKEVSIAAVQRISVAFGTTLTSSAIRLVEESADDCYVVFSCDGYVKWWKRKDTGPGFWIEPGQPIAYESIAFGCDCPPERAQRMRRVSPRAWFQFRDEVECEVWEQSVNLGEYDITMSLLYVIY